MSQKYLKKYKTMYAMLLLEDFFGHDREFWYSLVHLVWPNTEELISQPFMGLSKIRLLLQDPVSPRNPVAHTS